jgi:hypothetical protein
VKLVLFDGYSHEVLFIHSEQFSAGALRRTEDVQSKEDHSLPRASHRACVKCCDDVSRLLSVGLC